MRIILETATIVCSVVFAIWAVIMKLSKMYLVTYIHSALQKPDSDMRIYCNSSADDLIYTNGNIEGVEGNFVYRDGNKTYRIRINSKRVR